MVWCTSVLKGMVYTKGAPSCMTVSKCSLTPPALPPFIFLPPSLPPFIFLPPPPSLPPSLLPPFVFLPPSRLASPPPSPNVSPTDRITLVASCTTAHPVSIRLFGQEQIPGCRQHTAPLVQWLLRWWCPVYPSDHLGLVLDLDLKTQSQNALKSKPEGCGRIWQTRPFVASEWESRRPWQPYQGRSIGVIILLRTLAVCAIAAFLAWATRGLIGSA
jgi:hypothetical protein